MSDEISKQTIEIILDQLQKTQKEKARLEEQLNRVKKYKLLLGIRGRIERLELLFQSKELFNGKKYSRVETWLAILKFSEHRLVNDLRNEIFRSGLTINDFCQCIGIIYGDSSDRVVRAVPLPQDIQDLDITQVVKLLKVDNEEPIEKTLHILVKKLKLIDKADVVQPAEESTTYIEG